MNRPDWKELTDDDGYEDGSFMVIGKVGPNEHIIVDEIEGENVVDESVGENAIQGQSIKSEKSTETPSPCELLPEEVRKIMEAQTSLPASVQCAANSTVSLAESLTPSFVTGDNPSLTTNGSSLSNSSTEAIFDNATNQVAHLTEENQVLKGQLEKNRELTKRNIETWRAFEANAAKQHELDKEKHEESKQLVLKLREEKEQLKSRISVLEGQMKLQETEDSMSLLSGSTFTVTKDELKSLEAKLSVKDDSLRRLKTLLEENEALLNEEKYQTELLKKLLREQELKATEVQPIINTDLAMLKDEWEKEREQNELTLEKIRTELESTKVTYEETLLRKDAQIETLKKEIEDLRLKLENLNDINLTMERNWETTNSVVTRLEHQLRQSLNENILLTTRVAAMKAENEQAANLKQEMEAFRLDYLTERENRSKVEEEKSLLLLQLSSLKEELKLSQNELDNLHKTHLTFATEHVNSIEPFVSLCERNSISPTPVSSSPTKILGNMFSPNKIMEFIKHDIFGSRDDEIANLDSQASSSSRVSNPCQEDEVYKSDYKVSAASYQRVVQEKEDALRYIEKLEWEVQSKENKIKKLQDVRFEEILKRREASSADHLTENVTSRFQMLKINSANTEDNGIFSSSAEILSRPRLQLNSDLGAQPASCPLCNETFYELVTLIDHAAICKLDD